MFIQHILVKNYNFNAQNPILALGVFLYILPQMLPNTLIVPKNVLDLGGDLNFGKTNYTSIIATNYSNIPKCYKKTSFFFNYDRILFQLSNDVYSGIFGGVRLI